jgi:hypothetical protein
MVRATQRLDERRFARAVLTEHDVDFARARGERHIVQSLDAGECLRDVARFEERMDRRGHGLSGIGDWGLGIGD